MLRVAFISHLIYIIFDPEETPRACLCLEFIWYKENKVNLYILGFSLLLQGAHSGILHRLYDCRNQIMVKNKRS